ncbi:ABC transporter ATP-binding protein [Pseudonocardiaceae bacterium YIM PH 21723]|nr:ABC transporter ATP-binding protein [Pseudonocardiaceae bacterium YIM PH 21723]
MLAGVVYQLSMVLTPLCLQYAIDDGLQKNDLAATAGWAGIIALVACTLVGGVIVMELTITRAATLAINEVRASLLDHALRLDRRTISGFGRGDLATRGTRDMDTLYDWLVGVASLITGLIGFTVMLTLIGTQESMLAIAGLATVPLLLAMNLVLPRKFGKVNDKLAAAHSSRADAVEELLSASVAVRGIGGEGPLVARHAERSAQVTEAAIATAKVGADWAAAGPFIPGMATAVGLLVGGQAVIDGRLTVGGLVAFTSWMGMLGLWVAMLTFRFTQLSEARTAARRVDAVLSAVPAITDPAHPVPLPDRGELRAEGLSVGPLHGIELTVPSGGFLVITGALSSGKSLLLRLLGRWELADEGTVTYGGVDLGAAPLAEVRRRIALVAQRPEVITGTIRDNLSLGRPELSDEDIAEACRIAAFDVPLDTAVGERGNTLSGGQLQRLALARALASGAEVLLLDDITSAVDTGTEQVILSGLKQWNGTIVFASHRDAVIAAADDLLDLPAKELVHG